MSGHPLVLWLGMLLVLVGLVVTGRGQRLLSLVWNSAPDPNAGGGSAPTRPNLTPSDPNAFVAKHGPSAGIRLPGYTR